MEILPLLYALLATLAGLAGDATGMPMGDRRVAEIVAPASAQVDVESVRQQRVAAIQQVRRTLDAAPARLTAAVPIVAQARASLPIRAIPGRRRE